MPGIPALGRRKQENRTFKVMVISKVSSRSPRATEDQVSPQQSNEKASVRTTSHHFKAMSHYDTKNQMEDTSLIKAWCQFLDFICQHHRKKTLKKNHLMLRRWSAQLVECLSPGHEALGSKDTKQIRRLSWGAKVRRVKRSKLSLDT